MTDTSREAVEALIAECREEGANAWYEEVANTLAALLDERDELRQALFDCYQASGADTDGANAREMASWKPYPRLVVEEVIRLRREADDDTEYDAQQQRIRDLEAEKHAAEQAAVGWRKEAERGEAEVARLNAENRAFNQGWALCQEQVARLAAKLDAALTAEAQAEWDIPPKVRAILADTDEGNGR